MEHLPEAPDLTCSDLFAFAQTENKVEAQEVAPVAEVTQPVVEEQVNEQEVLKT